MIEKKIPYTSLHVYVANILKVVHVALTCFTGGANVLSGCR